MAFSLHPDLELVDIHTSSRTLAEILLSEYPEPIREENYTRAIAEKEIMHSFIGLCWGETHAFLEEMDKKLSPADNYEVRGNAKGEFKRVRFNGKSYTDECAIDAFLKERLGI